MGGVRGGGVGWGKGGGVGPGALGGPGEGFGGLGWGVVGPLVPIGPTDPFKGVHIVDPHLYLLVRDSVLSYFLHVIFACIYEWLQHHSYR